jgi:peptide/nickel transport system permease protein
MSEQALERQGGVRGWLSQPNPRGRTQASLQQLRKSWQRFCGHPLGLLGLAVIVLLIVVAICAPLLTSYDPIVQNMAIRLAPPSWEHLLGTDEFGRDVYSRIVYGARTTLQIIILVAVIVRPSAC